MSWLRLYDPAAEDDCTAALANGVGQDFGDAMQGTAVDDVEADRRKRDGEEEAGRVRRRKRDGEEEAGRVRKRDGSDIAKSGDFSGRRKREEAGRSGTKRDERDEAGRAGRSGTGPILLSQATFLLAHIANSGPVPLSRSDPSRFPASYCQ